MRQRVPFRRRTSRSLARSAWIACVLCVVPSLVGAQAVWNAAETGLPRTAAETEGFARHTSHAEMWAYLETLRDATTGMRLGAYGRTWEGRELPYAVFGRPLARRPWEAWALDRPVVLLAANVHGDERTFREGLLVLMRHFVTPGTEAYELLDRVTVIVTPQLNPDGFEAGEAGTRGNAWGIDLNRDYVKLEQPSLAAFVTQVLGAWRPHVFVDGHDGGSRPYNLNYQCPSHFDAPRELTELCDGEIFPRIDARLASDGLKSWYYKSGDVEEWRTGDPDVRIGRNYAGLVNSVGILFEAPPQALETGARAGYLGYLTVVRYAAEQGPRLVAAVTAAREETVALGAEPRGEVTVRMEYVPEDEPVSYELPGGPPSSLGGADASETIAVTGARLLKKPIVTRARPRPWAYLLPPEAKDAAAMLLRHGIAVERLERATRLPVEAYRIAGVTYEQAYDHAKAVRVEVRDVVHSERIFASGTFVVPTAQILGRLAAHMLEPETRDNVVYWNAMDEWIETWEGTSERAATAPEADADVKPAPLTDVLPIYKLMRPTALGTRPLEKD